MINVSIKSLAEKTQTSVNYLIEQCSNAGINKTELDFITNQEKDNLLEYLNNDHNIKHKKLILQRKKHTTLNISSTSGKTKSIKIEVRKKQTYIQYNLQTKTQEHELFQKNTRMNLAKKIKYIFEEKEKKQITKNEIIEKNKHSTKKNNKHIKQKTNVIKKSIQTIKEFHLKDESEKIKNKKEKETYHKIEKKDRKVVEEVKNVNKKNSDIWKDLNKIKEENNTDYNITTYYHVKEAENKKDIKIENKRKNKTKNIKIIKQKKNNRLYEPKSDHEEFRTIYRTKKNQYKKNTIIQKFKKPTQIINRNIIIGETITVSELANKMAVKGSQVIKSIIKLGAMATINQIIDQETAQLIAEEMGHKVTIRNENELEKLIMSDRDIDKSTISELRAPVVTIMGHVDHGKTSLLDYIRSTKIAKNEVGGITQNIGAYHVKTKNGIITFLDTPGHAAFTAMRSRGVQATDIVVLVIAADDGVMPQTIEAIQHAKAANVPIIIAINKIDKKEKNLNHIKNELTKYNIIPDEWGGENQYVYISAKFGTGINELLETILLQAEMLELKTIKNSMSSGIVIESFLDKGRGPVATVLIREGTLRKGDIILCGLEYGRIRAMRNELGKNIISAGPSIPVEIFGLSGVPYAGDKMTVVRNEKKAREVSLYRQGKFREIKLNRQHKLKTENIFDNMIENHILELNIILKSNVQGSIEAINDTLNNLSNNNIKIKIIRFGVGSITDTDVILAAASNAILIGFNTHANTSAKRIIKSENVDLRYYSVIYNLIDEIKQKMESMLIPKYKKESIGLAEVRNIFHSPKFGTIAGCMVTSGIIKNNNKIQILRKNIIIYEGKIESLRHFKEDVNEVHNGMECGISIKNCDNVCSGDIIKTFETIIVQNTMEQ